MHRGCLFVMSAEVMALGVWRVLLMLHDDITNEFSKKEQMENKAK